MRRARPHLKDAPLTASAALIAAAGVLAACGPRVRPGWAEDEAKEPAERTPVGTAPAPGRRVLLGEMCPEGAGGRPAVAPLLVRGVSWSADADAVAAPVERDVRAFAVMGLDGTRAGVFEVLGAADVGLPADVAIGSYSGRSPCAPASEDGAALADKACVAATSGCGIAIATMDRGDDTRVIGGLPDETEVPEVATGAACVSGDSLVVDIDGDGAPEAFALASFVDAVRAPAEEVVAAPVVAPACEARFAVFGHTVAPAPEPGVKDDPRYHVILDIVGVADLDSDGRRELVIAFRYPQGDVGRTIALYSAVGQSGRLELVGEAVPWQ